jgi:hypothetical protein
MLGQPIMTLEGVDQLVLYDPVELCLSLWES